MLTANIQLPTEYLKMFKESFKYYKSKISPPDLQEVINFYELNDTDNKKVRKLEPREEIQTDNFSLGLVPLKYWEIFEIKEKHGLLFIRNPFTSLGQRYWTTQCLKYYTKKPNKLNLDPFKEIPNDENWWQFCQKNKNYELLKKLRWATLGYHHNWDTKVYSESSRSEFPSDLAQLSKVIAKVIGSSNFEAQAAIVNYYHLDSTLSGHTDHSEVNLEAPLISFSLGQTAIFLLGGRTLDEKPLALFLHSGDIVIMTKDARLCYHGVPRIMKTNYSPWDKFYLSKENSVNVQYYSNDSLIKCQDEDSWQPFGRYLEDSRININVRQVLHDGRTSLPDGTF